MIHFNIAYCRQKVPVLQLQVEPGAVTAGAPDHHLADGTSQQGAAAAASDVTGSMLLWMLLMNCLIQVLLQASGSEILNDLPDNSMARPGASVDQRRLAAGQTFGQEMHQLIFEVT